MKIQKQFDNLVWFEPIDFGPFEVTLFCVLPHYQTNQWSIRLKVSGAAKNESPFVTLSYISGTEEDAIRAAERIADCLFSKQCDCSTDKAAHVLMQFDAEKESLSGRTTVGNYVAFYHENRLYSVRNTETDIISLVKASNPYVAIEKVMGNVKETEPKTHSVNREKAATYMISNEQKEKIDVLSYEEKDQIYRYLWQGHIENDVREYVKSESATVLTDEQITEVAARFVHGDYDCNIDYWSNIGALVHKIVHAGYNPFEKVIMARNMSAESGNSFEKCLDYLNTLDTEKFLYLELKEKYNHQ